MSRLTVMTVCGCIVLALAAGAFAQRIEPADLVILDAKIITMDPHGSIAQALAVRDGRIVTVGGEADMMDYIGRQNTRVLRLGGKTVIPGLIETHCHAIGIGENELEQPYAELSSIAEIQQWLRERAKQVPAGQWIRVPRTEVTRLIEKRFPTPAELDAACSTHPVFFRAITHVVLNSMGFDRAGVTAQTKQIAGGRLLRDEAGRPRLIIDGGGGVANSLRDRTFTEDERLDALASVHRKYNEVGITSIFERATNIDGYHLYEKLRQRGDLTVRMTATFRNQFKDGAAVEKYVQQLGLKPGDGDEWIKPGPLKITVDGGIHWGTTYLREPYGPKRMEFYYRDDPGYRGDLRFSVERMTDIFATAHRLGWQTSAHVTGDAGVEAVLDALEASDRITPVRDKRFNFIHAYFPDEKIARRAAAIGAGVDTQSYLYYRDADFIANTYGMDWAERFMAVGEWMRAGVPVAINSDHMIGLDPDHAMNSFNPFLQMWIAVARIDDRGNVYGSHQRVSRLDALRCVTIDAAWLSFDETNRGSLETGKLADLVVIDRDLLTCAVDEIRDIKPLMTIVDGKTVYERK